MRAIQAVAAAAIAVGLCNASAQLNGVSGLACTKRSDCGLIPSLGCVQGHCARCVVDADCAESSSSSIKYRCAIKNGEPQCLNKDVFSPFTGSDVLASILAAFATAMGAACGLGGGGLLVPLYIVVVGLSPKFAIPLSKATILGGAVSTFWSTYNNKHPFAPRRPLIDYATSALMEPATLLGTIIGVMANVMFPSWLILALLILLLAFVTYKVVVRANKMYAKENADALLPASSNNDTQECIDPACEDENGGVQTAEDIATKKLFTKESRVFPFRSYVLPLIVCIGAILGQSLLRGGHGAPSAVGIKCGSAGYWLLLLPFGAILLGVTYWMGKKQLDREKAYEALGLETVEGDVKWTPYKAYVLFPLQCIAAGFASALLGGMVQGPVMLENGITPLVQSASTSYMILYTSTSTTIQYTIAGQFPGQLQYDFVCWYVAMGFLGGLFGKTFVQVIIKKTGRMSYFLYFLALNSVAQAIAMGYIGIRDVVHDIQKGASMGFSSLCHD
ncbi:hypothetical protein Ae201684P_003609 [Aphanomyces euteiches]|nr:hypothetical protein Ae201684P_003609 [Aphanomyces euteiches]